MCQAVLHMYITKLGSHKFSGQNNCLQLSEKGALPIAELVKNLPAIQETQVLFLAQEDPLEQEMATHSSILAWKIPRTEEPGEIQSMGSQESDTT